MEINGTPHNIIATALGTDELEIGGSSGSTFTWELRTNDGSESLDICEEDGSCMIYQGDFVVGVGNNLLEAWNDYLHPLSPSAAPVSDEALAEMWAAYDKSNNPITFRPAGDTK